ncbi:MAG: hypothetical protein KF690_08650 [Bacteroidetes bacterium]|nr:hypothetical protein [Bacteroidota bacterium]
MLYRLLVAALLLWTAWSQGYAQDTIADILEGNPIPNGFQQLRLVHIPSGAMLPKHQLRIQFAQRFGQMGGAPGEANTFLGIDKPGDIQLAADYGLSNRLGVGIARSTHRQLAEGYLSVQVYRQKKGKHPLTLTLMQHMGVDTRPNAEEMPGLMRFGQGSHRIGYATMLVASRRLSQRWSLLAMPGFWHRNYVDRFYFNAQGARVMDSHSNLVVAAGLRWQATSCIALVADYVYNANPFYSQHPVNGFYRMPLGLAAELTSGPWRLQGHLSNAPGISPFNHWSSSPTGWDAGGLHMGFRFTYDLWLKKPEPKVNFEWSEEEITPEG